MLWKVQINLSLPAMYTGRLMHQHTVYRGHMNPSELKRTAIAARLVTVCKCKKVVVRLFHRVADYTLQEMIVKKKC